MLQQRRGASASTFNIHDYDEYDIYKYIHYLNNHIHDNNNKDYNLFCHPYRINYREGFTYYRENLTNIREI